VSRVRSRFSDRGGRLRFATVAFWAGLVALGVVGSSIPATAATTSFSLGHLRLGDSSGPEDYVFTTGDVVFPDGGADTGSYYRAVVRDAAGTVRDPEFPCTSAAAFASTNNTYTVQASDPPSTSTSWTFTLQQWNNATCTGNPTKTASKKFFVAKPTVYADSALTTPKSTFGTSGTAYVTVAGLKPGTNDWTTTWITPSGTTACANTGGGDRPDVPSTGVLAGAGGYLQYRPNTTAVGATWNRQSNYETRPCPSFSSASQGAWRLRLGLDGKDFVILSAFTVDATNPVVTLIDKPPALTNQTTATFSFASSKAGSTFECALDGAPFTSCSSPVPYGGLGGGPHAFAVRATAGTTGPATTYRWTVDTVPPQTTISSTPPADSHSRTAAFAFTSGEANSTFTCRLNSGGFVPCSSPHAYNGLGDGMYTFRVQAVDAAGNADTTPAVYTWKISGVGPPIVDLKPPSNVGKVRRNVGYGRLQLRWKRPADADFDHVDVYVSTSRKTPPRRLVYTGRRQSYSDRHFKNGQYYRFLVVSYDRAKNASGGRSVLVPPNALLSSPRNGSIVHGVPTFRWAAVRGASFYNIQLYRNGAKILSAWPAKARRTLGRRWLYLGHRYKLRRGLYVWYVWPGFGARAHSRYGQLLGEGTFRVR
jgi:hypothetical protein